MSLLGNYETASVYYQGVIQQIHRLLSTIDDQVCQFSQLQFHKFFYLNISMIFQGRKQKWQQIQGEVAQEYDVVKNIMQTLALFKGTNKVENICLVIYLVRDCDVTKRTIKIKKCLLLLRWRNS